MPPPAETVPSRRGVLFDVGYGLLDETARCDAALTWLSEFLATRGVQASPERLRVLYREACIAPVKNERGVMVQTALSAGASPELALEQRRRMPWDQFSPMPPLPGAVECLRGLRAAGVRVGVLANQPASARDDLERCGALELLDGVWLSEEVGLHKPDLRMFQLALDQWAMPAAAVAYVGDRPDNDVGPARRVGMYTVRLLAGPHAAHVPRGQGEQANFEARSLAEAAEHLLRWAAA